jgi:hypothetical protein
MVFGWSFGKDEFYKESARNLVKSASIFSASSTVTVKDSVPLNHRLHLIAHTALQVGRALARENNMPEDQDYS